MTNTVKPKCLVTGASGMMPGEAARYLVKHHPELDVYGVDDMSESFEYNIPEGIHFTKMDLRDSKAVKEYFNEHFSDGSLKYVMNYAASAAEIQSYFCPENVTSRNYDLFRTVLVNSLRHNVPRIIYFSSMSRYGDGCIRDDNGNIILEQPLGYKESYFVNPQDPYASSKVACELLLKSFKHVYNFDYTIFVPFSCFAPTQFPGVYRNFLAIWMNLILFGKEPTIYGTGENIRAISFTDDFTPTTCEALFNPKAYNQTFNIGGGEHKSINEWWDLVKKVSGTSLNAIHRDPRPGEVARAYCDTTKAKQVLGFENKTSAEDALKQMWDYFVAKGPREFKYIDEFEIESDKIPKTWKNKLF